jgi:predicted DNA-binding transcriptional regulator AlpA
MRVSLERQMTSHRDTATSETTPRQIEIPDCLAGSQLLGTAELGKLLNYTPVHIRRLVNSGKLPSPVVIGGRKLAWRTSTIQALLNSEGVAVSGGSK